MKRNENAIIKACLTWLHLNRFYAIRVNQGGFYNAKGSFYRMTSVPGISDILAVKHGKLFCVEVKKPGGTLRPTQRVFRDDITRAGAVYFVVHDTIELEAKINENT